MGTLALVHGAWHGAWTREEIVPLLEGAGQDVEAPDLSGHGDDDAPVPEGSLRGYTDRIREVLDARSEPGVLVGHSTGASSQARPEKVTKPVYLTGSLRRRDAPDPEAVVLRTSRRARTRARPPFGETRHRRLLRRPLREDVERASIRLVSQPASAFVMPASVTQERFSGFPRDYVECLRGRAISIAARSGCKEVRPARR